MAGFLWSGRRDLPYSASAFGRSYQGSPEALAKGETRDLFHPNQPVQIPLHDLGVDRRSRIIIIAHSSVLIKFC